MTADDSLPMTADYDGSLLQIKPTFYINQDKTEPKCKKFCFETDRQMDKKDRQSTRAGVELLGGGLQSGLQRGLQTGF